MTMWISHVLLLPEGSTAVYWTVVSPLGKTSPGAWLLVTLSGAPRRVKRQPKPSIRERELHPTLTSGEGNGSMSSKLCAHKNKKSKKTLQKILNSTGSRGTGWSSLAFHCCVHVLGCTISPELSENCGSSHDTGYSFSIACTGGGDLHLSITGGSASAEFEGMVWH